MRVLIVGSGAREHALAKAFSRSSAKPLIYCCGTHLNPGIHSLSTGYWQGDIAAIEAVTKQAKKWSIDLTIIGPEAPLEKGLADLLKQEGISVVGLSKYWLNLKRVKPLLEICCNNTIFRVLLNFAHFPP